MKLRTTFLLLLPLCVVLLGSGCDDENEQDIWEISPDSKSVVIQKEVDGIEFKFCLLNKDGEAATVFNEGENITFHFLFKNSKDDTITVTTEFINDDFFRVYQISSDNLTDMGKPWTGVWCEYKATKEIELKPTLEKQLNCPWILTGNNAPDYPLCMSESKNYLDIGEYSTSVYFDFHYTINDTKYIIDNITFTINFSIQ